MNIAGLLTCFNDNFSGEPRIFRAPGRINLIGEHTDYNLGYVLPAAIDKAMYFAVRKREDDRISVIAYDLDERISWKLGDRPQPATGWVAYIYGMVDIMDKGGYPLSGFDCVFGGDIPFGAGVSSSAALESGMGCALRALMDLSFDDWELVKMALRTEHEYVGLKCGVMDMFACVFGRQDKVMLLDCRSLEHQYVPFDIAGYALVLCDTKVSHSLASTEYNTRRMQCEKGIQIIRKQYPDVESLRDVSLAQLDACKSDLDPVIYKRCRYVIEENHRVLAVCKELESGNLDTVGSYLYASHDGLQHEYEVSCPELDFLVDLTREDTAVLGSRMMGGGFGGCTINLVDKEALDSFSNRMKEAYRQKWDQDLPLYIMHPGAGVGEFETELMG
ncbi:MAG: galactokinase [Bacteroidota bacterium]